MRTKLIKLAAWSFVLSLVIVVGFWILGAHSAWDKWIGTLFLPSLFAAISISRNVHHIDEIWMFVAMVFQTFLMVGFLGILYFGVWHLLGRKLKRQSLVSLTEKGFELIAKGEVVSALNWDDVDEIVAFKRDLLTTDLLCLDLHSAKDGLWHLVHEEGEGFEEFLSVLEVKFDVPRPGWWDKVVKPAFKENRTVLYKKAYRELLSDESKLIGKWILDGKKVIEDETATRVRHLVKEQLTKIAEKEKFWVMLYRDPADGRYWEQIYLEGELHGGGPPSLIHLSKEEVKEKYGIE